VSSAISAFAPGAEVDERLSECRRQHLGSIPGRELFRTGYLSRVIGLELTDGRRVVVKARPFAPRLFGCAEVQRLLFERGYPCPELFVGHTEVEGLAWSAEVLVPGGAPLPRGTAALRLYSELLARLIGLAPAPSEVASLVGWDHAGDELWPLPDDLRADLNDISGAGWLDDPAGEVRRELQSLSLERVLGHGDWYSLNIDWRDEKPVAVHDWDSVIGQPEAAIVGTAAAVFPAGHGLGARALKSQKPSSRATRRNEAGHSARRRYMRPGRPDSGYPLSTARRSWPRGRAPPGRTLSPWS
jgi:hypothetical protein